MSEERFRERRSAFTDDVDAAEEAPPAPSAEAEIVEPGGGPEDPQPSRSPKPPPAPSPQPRTSEGPLEPFDVPEPSFLEIVELLAIQALQLMGENPLGVEGPATVRPQQAQRFIDLIAILQERTRGNLEPVEAQALEQVLSDLRVRYLRLS